MRNSISCLWIAGALLLVAGCQTSSGPISADSPAPSVTLAPTAAPAVPSPTCDPVDELFADMFVGLSAAALANADITPEEFFTALAGNRELLRSYFDTLDIPVDEAWIDDAMSADLGERLLRQTLDGCTVFED